MAVDLELQAVLLLVDALGVVGVGAVQHGLLQAALVGWHVRAVAVIGDGVEPGRSSDAQLIHVGGRGVGRAGSRLVKVFRLRLMGENEVGSYLMHAFVANGSPGSAKDLSPADSLGVCS